MRRSVPLARVFRRIAIPTVLVAWCASTSVVSPPVSAQPESASSPPRVRFERLVVRDARRTEIASPWLVERMRDVLPSIEARCVSAEHARNPSANGVLPVRFTVGRTGRLGAVVVGRGDATSARLSSCIRSLLAATTLDRGATASGATSPTDDTFTLRATVDLWVLRSLSAPPPPDALTTCTTPDPSGCARRGCPSGMRCDRAARCAPSTCSCDPSTNLWLCTEDCGGGVCVPER